MPPASPAPSSPPTSSPTSPLTAPPTATLVPNSLPPPPAERKRQTGRCVCERSCPGAPLTLPPGTEGESGVTTSSTESSAATSSSSTAANPTPAISTEESTPAVFLVQTSAGFVFDTMTIGLIAGGGALLCLCLVVIVVLVARRSRASSATPAAAAAVHAAPVNGVAPIDADSSMFSMRDVSVREDRDVATYASPDLSNGPDPRYIAVPDPSMHALRSSYDSATFPRVGQYQPLPSTSSSDGSIGAVSDGTYLTGRLIR